MRITGNFCALSLAVLVFGKTEPLEATCATPDDVTIEYVIYDDPDDESGRSIDYLFQITLTPISCTETTVTWDILEVLITAPNPSGDFVWLDESPTFDGVSSVTLTHTDPENPELSEMLTLPNIKGTAERVANVTDPLDYEIETVESECDSSCSTLFTPLTTAAWIYTTYQSVSEGYEIWSADPGDAFLE